MTAADDGSGERLDLAVDWLRRSLDELALATRRTQAVVTTPAVTVPVVPAAAVPPAAARAMAPADGAIPGSAPAPSAPAAAPSTTPLLDKLGRDLVALAKAGKLSPVVGRTSELDWIVEILCRTTKRNPVLLGPAGSGKTAIVEGLAQRIAAGRVPPPLQGVRIVEVPLGSLVAGTEYRGQLEERLDQLVREASQPGIILFFDEIHLLAGAGGSQGGIAAGEVLKPALGRGDIAVIGATTDEEYRATIGRDAALARRFTTVAISELDRKATLPILRALRDSLAAKRGIRVSDGALDVLLEFADTRIANRRFPDKAIDLLEQAVAAAVVAGRTRVDRAAAIRTIEEWEARASSTPTLERFGRDLVALAKAGRLGPIVGREREIDTIGQTLLRHSKRNPLLLGPAGAGKTAIVEGFAIRLASGAHPDALEGVRVFDVGLLGLAAAVASEPDLMAEFLTEARHPSVIVFFDEVHLLMSPTVKDLGEALKPALSRGNIACIGATTGEEYQASIETDPALDRRFTIVPVEPMDAATVRTVLGAVAASLARRRNISFDDAVLDDLIPLADQAFPNRAFPDKGVDLVEQVVAYAVSRGLDHVDAAIAREAASAVMGRSLDPTAALADLGRALAASGSLDDQAAAALLARLGVTLRGIDATPARPNAVVLLAGPASAGAGGLATVIAGTVLGNEAARIDVDLGALSDDHDISTLLGSAPGLIGSDRPLPLAGLRQDPRQVVTFGSIERCAASIRETVAAGLDTGSLSDAMGRPLPLGSAIVVLTAPEATGGDRETLAAELGDRLLGTVDVVATTLPSRPADDGWLRDALLVPLADRLARNGWRVTFGADFITWLRACLPADRAAAGAYLDRTVAPLVVAALQAAPAGAGGSGGVAGSVELGADGDAVVARTAPSPPR